MKTGIYLIKNKLNGHCYVGKSIDIEERWKRHIRDSKKPEFPIHKAIAKYGIENFEFSILEECSAEQLNDREIHWIDEFDSFNTGYNCTLGGDGTNQGKDSYSAEYKRAWSAAYREEHPDEVSAYSKAWNKANPEKVRAKRKAYREAHKNEPEYKMKESAASKAYYEANKEKVIAARKAYNEANKEKVRAYKKAWYEAHKLKPTKDFTDMPLW